MFKRTWQVVFWGARNYFRHPKQLATRLKARDGLHSEVVAPEDEKARTKNKNKLPLYTDRFAKRTTAEKENELYLCFSSIATRISSFSDIMSRD